MPVRPLREAERDMTHPTRNRPPCRRIRPGWLSTTIPSAARPYGPIPAPSDDFAGFPRAADPHSGQLAGKQGVGPPDVPIPVPGSAARPFINPR